MTEGDAVIPWQAVPLPAGLSLRRATGEDETFLRGLYIEHRLDELAAVPWLAAAKQAFLRNQYDLQQRHYATYYEGAASLVVMVGAHDVGRLYLHASAAELRIVDILLDGGARGQGTGTTLLLWSRALADHLCVPNLSLHVECGNLAARRLYERLGFVASDTAAVHIPMTWTASRPAALS